MSGKIICETLGCLCLMCFVQEERCLEIRFVIGYKLAFYRENFNISILEHDLKYSLEHVKPEPLSIKRQSLVQCLHELLLVKGSQLIVNGFISKEIDDMITFICSK